MSENMVERVARAISQSTGFYPDGSEVWRQYEKAARAAMEAMDPPTEAMIAAFWHGMDDYYPNDESIRASWQAMLTAALKP